MATGHVTAVRGQRDATRHHQLLETTRPERHTMSRHCATNATIRISQRCQAAHPKKCERHQDESAPGWENSCVLLVSRMNPDVVWSCLMNHPKGTQESLMEGGGGRGGSTGWTRTGSPWGGVSRRVSGGSKEGEEGGRAEKGQPQRLSCSGIIHLIILCGGRVLESFHHNPCSVVAAVVPPAQQKAKRPRPFTDETPESTGASSKSYPQGKKKTLACLFDCDILKR